MSSLKAFVLGVILVILPQVVEAMGGSLDATFEKVIVIGGGLLAIVAGAIFFFDK